MYGRAEHSETLRRIMRVANAVEELRADVQGIRDDLRSDDWQTTTPARDVLNCVSGLLREAYSQLDVVPEVLPTPVAEPDPAALARALFRGGGNDVA